ncbi:MAG: thioredoxin family protein [Chloroflexota bacterium]|nr:thioredoxin family protein [Chloroflexota bacterium]
MPGWQHFYAQRRSDNFELISVAMEHTGGDAARPFVEQAHPTFPTVVDEHGVTSTLLGFKAVPNGVLVDEDGVIRWAKYGGFSIDKPEDVEVVERFLRGEDPGPSPVQDVPYTLGPLERELVDSKLRLGRLLDSLNRREEAVTEWQAALRLDPENLVIRKQVWAAEHPEKFHPTIDWDWQREQLKQERENEIAAGVCGPDGSPVPWA